MNQAGGIAEPFAKATARTRINIEIGGIAGHRMSAAPPLADGLGGGLVHGQPVGFHDNLVANRKAVDRGIHHLGASVVARGGKQDGEDRDPCRG